jgi:hypothetical protein
MPLPTTFHFRLSTSHFPLLLCLHDAAPSVDAARPPARQAHPQSTTVRLTRVPDAPGLKRAVGCCSACLVRLCRTAHGRAWARSSDARQRARGVHATEQRFWDALISLGLRCGCLRCVADGVGPALLLRCLGRARAAVATEGRLCCAQRIHHLLADAPRGSLGVLGTHSGVPCLSQVSRRSCGLSCARGASPCAAGWRRCCRCCRSAAQHDDQEGFLSCSSCVLALCRTPEHVVRVQAPSLDRLALALHSARAARVQRTLGPCHEMKEYANKDNRTIKQRGPKGLLCEESESVVKSRVSLLDQKLL